MMRFRACLLGLVLLCPGTTPGDEIDTLITDLRAVKAEGVGAREARIAWDRLLRQGPKALPRILDAMDTPDPVVANWLRLAFETIVEANPKAIEVKPLLTFIRDANRQGRTRRLALDLVERLQPGTKDKLLADWLEDPEFRADAIDRFLDRLQRTRELDQEKRIAMLRKAFTASRDLDQARTIAARLKEQGVSVCVADHMGFLRVWQVIGPFDGKNRTGFRAAYPPERKVDLDATLVGKDGRSLRWQPVTIAETPTGRFPALVDLRKPLGDAVDAVAYAWTAIEVPREQTVQVRGAADDNLSIWVNGGRAFGFEEYQNGVRLDRHRFAVKLRAGVNTILVKVCQSPFDPDNTALNWEFLLRITDSTGKGLLFAQAKTRVGSAVPAAREEATSSRERAVNARSVRLPVVAREPRKVRSTPGDWPGWRGPNRDGLSDQKGLPITWSATENLRWKVAIPGTGVSAPIVAGEQVFLTSSGGKVGEELHLVCIDRISGRIRWHRRFFGSEVSEGQFTPGGMAVPTPTTDGKYVYALYGTGDLVCLDMDGKPVWIRSLAREYGVFRNRWGMASSPLLVDGLLVVLVDHFGQSYLLGVDAQTGRNRWRTLRDATVNWTSPVGLRVGEKTLIVTAGTKRIQAYDASTGEEQWAVPGLQTQCIPTPLVRNDRIWVVCGQRFTSLCVRVRAEAAGKTSATIEWTVPSRGNDIPSPLCSGEYYYYLEDAGFISCLNASTGKLVWRQRLGGKVQASPVSDGKKLYIALVNGTVMVLQAGGEFKVLAKNDLGESIIASPAVARGCLFLRGEKHLFCIGSK
jgi:outer membrane protein assembly factor BamB